MPLKKTTGTSVKIEKKAKDKFRKRIKELNEKIKAAKTPKEKKSLQDQQAKVIRIYADMNKSFERNNKYWRRTEKVSGRIIKGKKK